MSLNLWQLSCHNEPNQNVLSWFTIISLKKLCLTGESGWVSPKADLRCKSHRQQTAFWSEETEVWNLHLSYISCISDISAAFLAFLTFSSQGTTAWWADRRWTRPLGRRQSSARRTSSTAHPAGSTFFFFFSYRVIFYTGPPLKS